jgi:hypothetical protein
VNRLPSGIRVVPGGDVEVALRVEVSATRDVIPFLPLVRHREQHAL